MMFRDMFEINTKINDPVDITDKIQEILKKCQVKEGLCTIFIPGTTAGLVINENDPLLMSDFRIFFEIASSKKAYAHPDNAHSHIRTLLAPCEKTIPVANGELVLGTCQSVLVWDFDTKPRKRKIIVTIMGE